MKKMFLVFIAAFICTFTYAQQSEDLITPDELQVLTESAEIIQQDVEQTENQEETAELADESEIIEEQADEEVPVESAEVIKEVQTENQEENPVDIFIATTNQLIELSAPSLEIQNIPDNNIVEIEQSKKRLFEILQLFNQIINEYNAKVDQQTETDCMAVMESQYTLVELDANGNPSEDAVKRREEQCNIIREEAEKKKQKYYEQQKDAISSSEKQERTYLAASYKVLEAGKYYISSYADNLKVEVGQYDGAKGVWPVKVQGTVFGFQVFKYNFDLSYEEVTGEKLIPTAKMTDGQLQDFSQVVEKYNTLFQQTSKLFCVRLHFDMLKWKQTSEYRLIPTRLEVLNVGRKNRVIKRFAKPDLSPFVFIAENGVEIRTAEEIQEETLRLNKILAKEAKNKETEADRIYKAYEDSYTSSKKDSQKEPFIQKGRGGLLVSASTFSTTEGPFNFDGISLDMLKMELCIPKGKHFFYGVSTGLYFPVGYGVFNMQFGLLCGLNCQIANMIRPYAKIEANFDTKYFAYGSGELGVDFVLAKVLLLNISYDLVYSADLSRRLDPELKAILTDEEKKVVNQYLQSHINVGIGFAW